MSIHLEQWNWQSEVTIKNTWNEFRAALANEQFRYNEVDSALTTTFLDLFTNCSGRLECPLSILHAKV